MPVGRIDRKPPERLSVTRVPDGALAVATKVAEDIIPPPPEANAAQAAAAAD